MLIAPRPQDISIFICALSTKIWTVFYLLERRRTFQKGRADSKMSWTWSNENVSICKFHVLIGNHDAGLDHGEISAWDQRKEDRDVILVLGKGWLYKRNSLCKKIRKNCTMQITHSMIIHVWNWDDKSYSNICRIAARQTHRPPDFLDSFDSHKTRKEVRYWKKSWKEMFAKISGRNIFDKKFREFYCYYINYELIWTNHWIIPAKVGTCSNFRK